MDICKAVNDSLSNLIKIRRELHVIPELSEKEFKTGEYISGLLKEMGYKVKFIQTGIYVDIIGENTKKRIALRCDMDALAIVEKNDIPFASKNDCMHACGHDGHMAILLTLANILKDKKPLCNLRLIFQFGEEGSGGASKMIANGVLNGVDEIYAIHLNPLLKKGELATCNSMFAGCVEFDILSFGKASHCANPELGVDTVKTLNYLINAKDKCNEKYKNNSLLHIGKIISGSARNVVSDKTQMLCTLRFFDYAAEEEIMMNITNLILEADKKFGTDSSIKIEALYPPLLNSGDSISKVQNIAGNIQNCLPSYTAEDFAEYLLKVPGCMIWLGVKDEDHNSPLHSSTFNFDETALLTGLELFYRLVF